MLSQFQAETAPGQSLDPSSAFPGAPARAHTAHKLEGLFAQCFTRDFNAQLQGGAREPLYEPAKDGNKTPARIVYREDFFASALHEVAHWCLAGERRRELVDYGYWYAPDGRDAQAQLRFEAAEKKPQALEWIFSVASGFAFQVSMDNLDGGIDTRRETRFRRAVLAQCIDFCAQGLPPRAEVFCNALLQHFFPQHFGSQNSFPLKVPVGLGAILEHFRALQGEQGNQ